MYAVSKTVLLVYNIGVAPIMQLYARANENSNIQVRSPNAGVNSFL